MIDSYSLLLCLQVTEDSVVVYKGCQPEVDSYSAFWDNNKMSQTELVSILAKHRVTDVFLCGVAYDVCVGKERLSVYSCEDFCTVNLSVNYRIKSIISHP